MDDVSFDVPDGQLFCLLGPNGVGKSTTLRMITGLARPDCGRATIAGREFAELPNPARLVGTLLDASAMHAGRTGCTSLRIAATVVGVPAGRADELLAAVGLAAATRRRVADRRLGPHDPPRGPLTAGTPRR